MSSQIDPSEDQPTEDSIFKTGVLANVLQLLKLPDGTVKVLVEGQEVGFIRNFDFIPDITSDEHSSKILTAARKALPKELDKKVNEFINSSEEALKIDNIVDQNDERISSIVKNLEASNNEVTNILKNFSNPFINFIHQ